MPRIYMYIVVKTEEGLIAIEAVWGPISSGHRPVIKNHRLP